MLRTAFRPLAFALLFCSFATVVSAAPLTLVSVNTSPTQTPLPGELARTESPLIVAEMMVGSVIVVNTATQLSVTYETFTGWDIRETHLDIQTSLAAIPQTSSHAPIVADFAFHKTTPGTTRVEFLFNFGPEMSPQTELYVAANAKVQREVECEGEDDDDHGGENPECDHHEGRGRRCDGHERNEGPYCDRHEGHGKPCDGHERRGHRPLRCDRHEGYGRPCDRHEERETPEQRRCDRHEGPGMPCDHHENSVVECRDDRDRENDRRFDRRRSDGCDRHEGRNKPCDRTERDSKGCDGHEGPNKPCDNHESRSRNKGCDHHEGRNKPCDKRERNNQNCDGHEGRNKPCDNHESEHGCEDQDDDDPPQPECGPAKCVQIESGWAGDQLFQPGKTPAYFKHTVVYEPDCATNPQAPGCPS